jgi:hypothetical protein
VATNRKPKPNGEMLVNFRAPRHLVQSFRTVLDREERTVSQDLRRYMAERVLAAETNGDPEKEAA